MTIAERIDALLKERRISRRQLAIKAGIPPSTFQSAMQRNGNMSVDMLKSVANALDTPWYELYSDSPEEQGRAIRSSILSGLNNVSVPEANSDDEEGEEFFDSMEETFSGSIVQKYTKFATLNPYLMQMIKDAGIELEIVNWRKVRIKCDYQDVEVSISELLNDLEILHSDHKRSIEALFKDNYGFDMDSNEED